MPRLKYLLIVGGLSLANLAQAQGLRFGVEGSPNFKLFLNQYVLEPLGLVVPLIASLALLAFFWGLVKFVFNLSGDTKSVKDGRDLMVWGTIALFIMVSVWGIIRFAQGELGFEGGLFLPLLPKS